jgi:hypothetical protein
MRRNRKYSVRRIKLLLKRTAWKILLHPTIQLIKKRHYLRLLRSPLFEKEPDNTDSAAHSVFKILCDQGYFAWWFDGSKLRKRRHGDKSTNYFFLKDNHIDILNKSELEVLST